MRFVMSLLIFFFAGSFVYADTPLSEPVLRNKITAATVFVSTDRGSGTGWVVDGREKIIITAGHVVNGVNRVRVLLPRIGQHGWVTSKAELMSVSPSLHAEIVGVVPHLDLAILRVPEMQAGAPALPLSMSSPRTGSIVYAVSHAAKMPTIFHFDKGNIEFTGFAAVTISEAGQPSVRLRAEIFAFQCKGIDRGSSGCALVNCVGEVVGFTTMGSGLRDSSKVYCVGVSVQELHHLIKKKNQATSSVHSLPGRWAGKFDNAPAEMGIEFKANGQASFIIPGGGKIACNYRLDGTTLHLMYAGKKETIQLQWTGDHTFRLIGSPFSAECKRHDGGLQ